MNGLIDIHSHILPLVDDGAESVEMALLMLKKAAEEGIEKIILTPHQKPDRRCVTPEGILRRMEELRELAGKENCVFVGRCADYILEQAELDHISLFIAAPFEWRVQRKMEQLSIDEKEATSMVRKKDKDRKAYYDYYTGRSWGRPHNYDLCINSSRLGIEVTSEKLAEMVLQLEKGTSSVDFGL